MGHIFPACLVSNEMVEIFVWNVWFSVSFAEKKIDACPGLAVGEGPGKPRGKVKRQEVLMAVVRRALAEWWPSPGGGIKSKQGEK